jgi:hypothetical protein
MNENEQLESSESSFLALLLFTFSGLLLREGVEHQAVLWRRVLSIVWNELQLFWHDYCPLDG